LSRLEASDEQVAGQPIDVVALLAVLRKDLLARDGGGHAVTVSVESPDGLMGDPGLIHSAFWNLADNAAEYTPAGGSILLRWWMDELGGHFSVEGAGPGTPSSTCRVSPSASTASIRVGRAIRAVRSSGSRSCAMCCSGTGPSSASRVRRAGAAPSAATSRGCGW
jgi:hypothetical protein